MPYFAYNVGGWVEKEDKMCLRNKSMAPYLMVVIFFFEVLYFVRQYVIVAMTANTWQFKCESYMFHIE
jgi:hypothetical protein